MVVVVPHVASREGYALCVTKLDARTGGGKVADGENDYVSGRDGGTGGTGGAGGRVTADERSPALATLVKFGGGGGCGGVGSEAGKGERGWLVTGVEEDGKTRQESDGTGREGKGGERKGGRVGGRQAYPN